MRKPREPVECSLKAIELLPLGCPIADAVALYGQPKEVSAPDDVPEFTQHVFSASPNHDVIVVEANQKVQSITYWSAKPDPECDLRCMLDRYAEGSRWSVLEEGYWYQRDDGQVRLWCSAMPAIGVAYVEFLKVQGELATANKLKQLDQLDDATWASSAVVAALQRRFAEGNPAGLNEWARRSRRIAVSSDGRSILVVREHMAYDVPGGFMELNSPPDPNTRYSTEVINCFTWSEDCARWQKFPLPTDATVASLRCEGDRFHLEIGQLRTNRVLRLTGTVDLLRRLAATIFDIQPLNDAALWKSIRAEAEPVEPGAKESPGTPP